MNLLKKYTPLGLELGVTSKIFAFLFVVAILFSLVFFTDFYNHRRELFENPMSEIVTPGAIMPDFITVLGGCLLCFWLVVAFAIVFAVTNYIYHHSGTNSYYLMRRLPSKFEYHKRCLTLPILIIILTAFIAFLLLLFYYNHYMQNTPEQCIAPNQWEKIWRFI